MRRARNLVQFLSGVKKYNPKDHSSQAVVDRSRHVSMDPQLFAAAASLIRQEFRGFDDDEENIDDRFSENNVLAWLDAMSEHGDLKDTNLVGQHLKSVTDHCSPTLHFAETGPLHPRGGARCLQAHGHRSKLDEQRCSIAIAKHSRQVQIHCGLGLHADASLLLGALNRCWRGILCDHAC